MKVNIEIKEKDRISFGAKVHYQQYYMIPSNPEEFGVTSMGFSSDNSHSRYKYCPNCGTWYMELDGTQKNNEMDSYIRMINGDSTDVFVVEKENVKERHYHMFSAESQNYFRSKNPWNGSMSVKYTSNPIVERIGYEWSTPTIVKDEHNNNYYTFTVTDTFKLTDTFLGSRKSINRIEIIPSSADRCIYCGEKFRSILECCNEIYNAPSKCDAVAQAYVEKCKDIETDDFSDEIPNPDIKKFLSYLIDLDSSIQYLQKSLGHLLLLSQDAETEVRKEKYKKVRMGTNEIDNQLERKRKEKQEEPELLSEAVTPEDLGLIAPQEPIYQKASIFNRKKVDEANHQLEENYRAAMEAYRKEAGEKVAEELSRRKQSNENVLKQTEQRNLILEREIAELEEEKERLLSSPDDSFSSDVYSFYQQEVDDIKHKIEELCQVRAKLLATNIIYGKYTDFVTLTTISEYFESGRCNALIGPNGAYNLYENESRENRIITQLDSVIDSLDQIKQTQYKTYEKICSIEKNTARMSAQLNHVAEAMQSIDRNVADIKNNTEITAYYSEKTAMYSKMQMQMTNALGYLVACK